MTKYFIIAGVLATVVSGFYLTRNNMRQSVYQTAYIKGCQNTAHYVLGVLGLTQDSDGEASLLKYCTDRAKE